jgi:ParB-like chromosome segregation protein Spo0J
MDGSGASNGSKAGQGGSSADLAITYRPIGELIPYARNARTHSEAQVALIAGSIREYGFTNPVLVDGANGIIAGHGRVLAARQLGLASVPTIELAHLTETQKQAYILADNRLAEAAGWDKDLLALELGDLRDLGVDLTALGFDLGELDALLNAGTPDPREDEVPDPPAVPVSQAGDLWLLGKHRLLCGDSTSAADVARLLNGVKPTLMVSDPPYGVAYDPAWRNRAGLSETKRTGKVLNDDRADWREAWALFPGDVAYVWHGALHATTVAESLMACGFAIRSQIIWAKERLVLSRGDYHWQHEPCWYAVRTTGKGHWSGDRKQTTLWSIPSRDQDARTVHGTQKPVECMRRPMLNNASPGQAVYEPFSGSGSSIISPRPAAAVRSPWSWIRPMSMWRSHAGRRSPVGRRCWRAMAAASPRLPPHARKRSRDGTVPPSLLHRSADQHRRGFCPGTGCAGGALPGLRHPGGLLG